MTFVSKCPNVNSSLDWRLIKTVGLSVTLVAEIETEDEDEEKSATVIDIFIDPSKVHFSEADIRIFGANQTKTIYV